jgi:hypothetical protein
MKYQLVMQFDANTAADFDKFVALEEAFIRQFGSIATVDGHDFGSGEFNIFVLTDRPREAFGVAQRVAIRFGVLDNMRAAYRELTADGYLVLWPPSLTEFTVA